MSLKRIRAKLSGTVVAGVRADNARSHAQPGGSGDRSRGGERFGRERGINEIVVTVVAGGSVTIGFNGPAAVADGSPVVSYSEAGFTIAPTAENWTATC